MTRKVSIEVMSCFLDKDTLDFMCCPRFRKGLFDRFVRSLPAEDKQSLVIMNFNALNHLIGNAQAKPFIDSIHHLYDTLQFTTRNNLCISGRKLTASNVDGEIRDLLLDPTDLIKAAAQNLAGFLGANRLTCQIHSDMSKLIYFTEAFRKFVSAGQTDEKTSSAITRSGGPLDSKHNSTPPPVSSSPSPVSSGGSSGKPGLIRTRSFQDLSTQKI